ncbi:MAG: aspartate--ammonia ligase, partial [Ruminococcaceae bacterium]|nr:aspartate--ammonia ligase [Oscillospiraceae bacterium]
MSKTIIPKGYKSNLTPYQTQGAIELVKRNFENEL